MATEKISDSFNYIIGNAPIHLVMSFDKKRKEYVVQAEVNGKEYFSSAQQPLNALEGIVINPYILENNGIKNFKELWQK